MYGAQPKGGYGGGNYGGGSYGGGGSGGASYAGGSFGGWKGFPGTNKGGWKGKGKGIMAFEEDEQKLGLDLHEEGQGQEETAIWGLQLDDKTEEQRDEKKVLTTKGAGKVKQHNRFATLASLEEEQDEGLIMAVSNEEYEGWKKVTATVDSASADHVAPEGEFEGVKMEPS